jgi:hypothetical protein
MKFGQFDANRETPSQVFEGDYMQMSGPYSIIYKYTTQDGGTLQTGHVHLAPGQSVRPIEESETVFNPRVR